MELINVLNLMAEGKIKEGTKLEFDGFEYEFSEDHFEDDSGDWLEDVHEISASFLNLEAELIPPKEKKYLVKLHIRGLLTIRNYLNYYNDIIEQWVELRDSSGEGFYQTRFTKQEMQDIQLVREFLEDMEGKYELIEVEE
ncbi:hypothetical protein MMJ46_05245 [Enterococcus cecorum]|uniref:hypothetical protein n=1 Tax=Enterococcus cecorum TaxID=44008 RepID=UPI001FABA751|nr:hypothetical protein [Enterococcus cecorum]MCJ0596716.1 hypothetical protein [Enterococcus cecorum]